MLTAIGMYRRHGRTRRSIRQTLSLLERGLDQIRHMVSALLVEVKEEPRELSAKDIDDIAELIAPQVRETHLQLIGSNRLGAAGAARRAGAPDPAQPGPECHPSDPEGEAMAVLVEAKQGTLRIAVTNAGEAIDEARLDRLFEPFARAAPAAAGSGSG
jgi:two-component system, NtrC family, sensor kinase